MVRAVPSPHQLVEPLRRLIAPPRAEPDGPLEPTTEERVLDAALEAFTENGIRATTMASIGRAAGVSREWIYKLFGDRDGLILAVTRREVAAFIDGLAVRSEGAEDFDAAVVDVFVYAVEYLRDHALLQSVIHSEADVISPRLIGRGVPIARLAIEAGAAYLAALGDLDDDAAGILAESLVRLAASTIVAPRGTTDFHDADQLRRYAHVTIGALAAAARGASPDG